MHDFLTKFILRSSRLEHGKDKRLEDCRAVPLRTGVDGTS